MNTFKKRIAGMVAAGLLTVSGVAMIAQPAYAEWNGAQHTQLENFDYCRSKGQNFKTCCLLAGGDYKVVVYDDGTRHAQCTLSGLVLARPSVRTGIVTTPGGAKPTPTKPSPVTGVVTTPGGTKPTTPTTSPVTGVVTTPVAPVVSTPTAPAPTLSVGSGIVATPAGAAG